VTTLPGWFRYGMRNMDSDNSHSSCLPEKIELFARSTNPKRHAKNDLRVRALQFLREASLE